MTMKRDGSFSVELLQPLVRDGGGSIDTVTIQPPRLVHLVRWQEGQIVSRLGLLSELCGLSEAVLQRLAFPDVDRVMFAFNYVIPAAMRESVSDGSHPLVTPVTSEQAQVEAQVNDPGDPRFPYVPGARKFPAPPVIGLPQRPPAEAADSSSLAQPPEIMKAV